MKALLNSNLPVFCGSPFARFSSTLHLPNSRGADVFARSNNPAWFQAGFVLKLLPTTVPVTLPMMAPATNSDNQWMLTETLKPM
jgi:hypothetical protein